MKSKFIQIIYTIFLALFIALFIGMGIDVSYKSPDEPRLPVELEYNTQKELTPELKTKQIEYDKVFKEFQGKLGVYNRNVSIIALVASILIMVLSLALLNKILILSDGLLLGGVFVVLYSMIRGFMSDSDVFRFGIVSVGLVIAITLGYIKFIRKPSKK